MSELNTSFWKDRPVLVTGATGLLGGWLVKGLVQRGAHVVALVRDGAPGCMLAKEGLLDRVATVHGDILDLRLLQRTLSEYSVDTLFHLAAQAIVGVAKLDPVDTLESNVRGTWNVLEAARLTKTAQIVVASSDKAYGPAVTLPYTEDHPLRGRYPYDVSKSCTDLICAMYATTYGLPVVISRCANLFGGGDLNFSRTIPGVILATLKGERFLIRSDGKFVRDLLYVKDAVEAYLLLAEKLAGQRALAGEAFNFGLGVRLTVLDIVERILGLMRRTDLEPIIQNTATSEIREQYLSWEKASRLLGWSPRYELEHSLAETIEWYQEYFASEFRSPAVAGRGPERPVEVAAKAV